jgi:hypothetical protein
MSMELKLILMSFVGARQGEFKLLFVTLLEGVEKLDDVDETD